MTITLNNLVGIIRHSDTLDKLIGGSNEANTPLTYGRLVAIANDPEQLKKLMTALDGLHREVSILRATKVSDL